MSQLVNEAFPQLLEIAVKSLLILLTASIVTAALRRSPAATRSFVWTLAIGGVLLLPVVILTAPRATLLPSWLSSELIAPPSVPATPTIAQATPSDNPTAEATISPTAAAPSLAESTASNNFDKPLQTIEPVELPADVADVAPAQQTIAQIGWTWPKIVLSIWFTGVAVNLLLIAVGLLRLIHLSRTSRPIGDSALTELLATLRHRIGIRRTVTLVQHRRWSTPATWGLVRPRILVPDDFETWSAERQHAVLAHELAHIQRGDHFFQLLSRFACSLYWFNPLIWFAAKQLSRERELACDDVVLRLGERPSDYAEHLLQVALQTRRESALVTGMVISIVRRPEISHRVSAILDETRRRDPITRWACLSGALVCVLVVVPLAMLQSTSEAIAEPAPPVPVAAEVVSKDAPLPKGAVFRLGTDRFRQEGEIQHLRYTSDGKRIASSSNTGVIIWDAETGRQLRQLRPRSDDDFAHSIFAIGFSPDNEEIAAIFRSQLFVWEVSSGLELLSFPLPDGHGWLGEDSGRIEYSPDGKQIAVMLGGDAAVIDVATGKLIKTLTLDNHAGKYGLCWTPDGKSLLAATLIPNVVMWDVETGKVMREFKAGNGKSFSYNPTISADGKMLIAPCGKVVNMWDLQTGKHLKEVPLTVDFANTAILTPDNQRLIACGQMNGIQIVDMPTGKARTINSRLWINRTIAVSPDYKTVTVGAVYPTLRQWDIETGKERFPELTDTAHDAEVRSVAYSPDGKLIASGGNNGHTALWDASTGKLVRKISSFANLITFSPSGKNLLTSWENLSGIRIFDVASGKHLRTLEGGAKRVRAFAYTADGKQLVSVVSNSPYIWSSPVGEELIQVWDFDAAKKLREFKFRTASTQSMAISPDGSLLMTGTANSLVHIIDLATGKELALLPGHKHSIAALSLSRDGKLLASGSFDQTIRLWDTQTWKSVRIIKGHERAINTLAFSPDGRQLISAGGARSYPIATPQPPRIRLWDVDTGKQIGEFSGHDTHTASVAFSPDGQRVVSGHDNTTILIWDVKQAQRP